MKTLYLLRHAKSERDDEHLDDRHRPLNKRGRRDCQLIAAELARQGRRFEAVFCSPALRATETFNCFMAEAGIFAQAEPQIIDELYTFDPSELLGCLRDLPHNVDSAMVIGHNPALAETAELLCDGKIGHVGTCTFIELRANIEYWDQLRGECAKLTELLRPKYFR